MSKASILALGALLIAVGRARGSSHAPPEGRKANLNVVLITLDTTRADRLGCYGYKAAKTPHLDRLAARGILFTRAYAQVPLTLPSHASILTGTYPFRHGIHNNGFYRLQPDSRTMAGVLRDHGYATAAFVGSFTVDSRFGLDQGFDVYDDAFDEQAALKNFRSERRADRVFAVFSDWLKTSPPAPFFAWVHLFDPHLPYDPPPLFRDRSDTGPYDGEIAYADFHVGKIVGRLSEQNLLDRTVIVVAGDHGEALGDKGEVDHGLFLYDSTLRVPFIMNAPNRLPSGLRIPTRVRLIDIMPTILDLVGIPCDRNIQGTSLMPCISGRETGDRSFYMETYYPRENYGWSELLGWVDGDWKFIEAPRPELYNMNSDPREEVNAAGGEVETAARMRRRLDQIMEADRSGLGPAIRRPSGTERERLRSLGYVTGGGPKPSGRALPDPKDKIEDYLTWFRGNLFETTGEIEAAARCYENVLRSNPDAPWPYVNLGFLYVRMDRVGDAIRLLEKARQLFPDSPEIRSRLMSSYFRDGKLQAALAEGEALLELEPDDFDALFLCGSIHGAQERWEKARSFFSRALQIEPENRFLEVRYAFSIASLGRLEEALSIYFRVEPFFMEDARFLQEMARVCVLMGKQNEARDRLEKALRLEASPGLLFDYAILLEKTQRIEEAIRYYELFLASPSATDPTQKTEAQDALRRLRH